MGAVGISYPSRRLSRDECLIGSFFSTQENQQGRRSQERRHDPYVDLHARRSREPWQQALGDEVGHDHQQATYEYGDG